MTVIKAEITIFSAKISRHPRQVILNDHSYSQLIIFYEQRFNQIFFEQFWSILLKDELYLTRSFSWIINFLASFFLLNL